MLTGAKRNKHGFILTQDITLIEYALNKVMYGINDRIIRFEEIGR